MQVTTRLWQKLTQRVLAKSLYYFYCLSIVFNCLMNPNEANNTNLAQVFLNFSYLINKSFEFTNNYQYQFSLERIFSPLFLFNSLLFLIRVRWSDGARFSPCWFAVPVVRTSRRQRILPRVLTFCPNFAKSWL